ncbi:ABC transporter permease [Sphaerimonospora cavernae]|uniref:ABC transporter permease n=1 Tax=Sphaerimonospora cavernae TaxID=1740611 RepID=A0ABV6U0T0_9ACTN
MAARQAGILLALALLVVVVGLIQPSYWDPSNLVNVLEQASITGILAVGVTFVIITAGIDLSFGSNLGLCAAALGLTLEAGWPFAAAVLLTLLVGALAGLVNGVLTTTLKITPLIVTLGTLSIFSGIALLMTNGRTIFNIPTNLDAVVNSRFLGLPAAVVVLVVVTAIASFILNRTVFGEYCIATGGNAEVARLAGIRVGLYVGAAYCLLGVLAGLAAFLTVGRLGAADPQAGADLLLPVIAASVIGGASLSGGEGSVVGAVIGAVFISALQAGLTILVIPAFYQQITVGAVIILAVTIDKVQRGEITLGRARARRA